MGRPPRVNQAGASGLGRSTTGGHRVALVSKPLTLYRSGRTRPSDSRRAVIDFAAGMPRIVATHAPRRVHGFFSVRLKNARSRSRESRAAVGSGVRRCPRNSTLFPPSTESNAWVAPG
jgi:hypothetical protein